MSLDPAAPGAAAAPTAQDEVVRICQDLLRIDTSNYGDNEGPGERADAEYVVATLREVGLDPELVESAPGRANVVVRLPGTDPSRDALVLHGHTDVVPAAAEDWSVDPFAGEERDGLLWGRGAVDMKDLDAMILAVVRQMARAGRRPARDVVLAMFADEEAGGRFGSHSAVTTRPELFEGAAEGRAGHGSQINPVHAVTHLAAAVARIGAYPWPLRLTPTVHALLQGVADLTGLPFDPEEEEGIARLIAALGPAVRFVGATVRNTANPSQLSAGYQATVIPGRAEAVLDSRFLPGDGAEVRRILTELAGPHVRIEEINGDVALDSLIAQDPGAVVLPYMLSAGTDNKALSRLGIRGYGFAPLRLDGDLDFPAMFHGVDERVPTDALVFGTRVLDRLLATC